MIIVKWQEVINGKKKDIHQHVVALLSRLWTGFFDTARCRYTEKFQNPDFSLKWRDFWVFL